MDRALIRIELEGSEDTTVVELSVHRNMVKEFKDLAEAVNDKAREFSPRMRVIVLSPEPVKVFENCLVALRDTKGLLDKCEGVTADLALYGGKQLEMGLVRDLSVTCHIPRCIELVICNDQMRPMWTFPIHASKGDTIRLTTNDGT